MYQHRLLDALERYHLPRPPAPPITAAGFMACPWILLQGMTAAQQCWQRSVYQAALELAQEVARPSLPERDLLAVWN
ncbi:MAG TPA: hypothetical protein VG013_07445 [Gemmataceae bacterium]|nr:hypothetical protein [Gemmataceae bacterium]